MKVLLSKTARFKVKIILLEKEKSGGIADFKGEIDEIATRYEKDKVKVYCGLGEKKSVTPMVLRGASARGVRKCLELRHSQISLEASGILDKQLSIAALEGALLGSYQFVKYKSNKPTPLATLEFVNSLLDRSDVNRIKEIADCVNYSRNLVNANAHEITPERIASEARAIGQDKAMKVTVLDEKEIDRLHLDLIKAVGQGSPTPPRMIIIEYNGSKSKHRTAIVGKGVTFDSGGQNLKPTGSIETMRQDMAGAAAVLGIMKAVAALKPALNILGVIPAVHNNIGGNAFFPGDIYGSFAGKTVEILSTDAEGRLILADAVAYTIKKYKPAEIIDLATLTGGILYAFADVVAGLFSNDDTVAGRLFDAGEKTGERLWRMPVYEEFSKSMESDIADLRNISKMKKGHGGSITGAAFIKEFAGETPWAHLDIAGTAFNESASRGEIPQFATGFGVRLLLEYLIGYNGEHARRAHSTKLLLRG